MSNKVLIIDDDKFVYNRLKSALEGFYDTRCALNGEKGLQTAYEWQPDFILLDIEMPGRNGYEVCDELKRAELTKDIPVLILSSKSSVRERMLGYEMGADDYITKGCAQEELAAKLHRLSKQLQTKNSLKKSVNDANRTALEAMSSNFELGKAIRFVERSQSSHTIDILGEQMMEFVAELELSAVAMVHCAMGCFFFSSTARKVAPLEAQLVEMLHREQRFIDFGCRTQINYPRIALLVKNMPLDNRERYGRLKDTLPFVIGATDAKIQVLEAEHALLKQNVKLSESVDSVRRMLRTVTDTFNNNLTVSSIMSELLTTLSIDLQRMGLDPDQEEFVGEKVEAASIKISKCLEEENRIEANLLIVVDELEKVRDEQVEIVRDKLSSRPVAEDDNKNDVELF